MRKCNSIRLTLLWATTFCFGVSGGMNGGVSGGIHLARASDAGAPASPAAPPDECVELVPSGATKPKLAQHFPRKGESGYAIPLTFTVEHGVGETVLPAGLRSAKIDSVDLDKSLHGAGFWFPHPDGGSGVSIARGEAKDGRVTTTVTIPVLALPDKPGRKLLRFPSLPITVSRSSGDWMTLCTMPARIEVDPPIASTSDPDPKPNPGPLPQLEEWTAMKRATIFLLIGILAGGILYFLYDRWKNRPVPPPPPVPARAPWEVALESLDDIRHGGLLDQNRHDVFVDRVNDTVRLYLGARYGFDGIESTSDEILAALKASLPIDEHLRINKFLRETDLIKFAKVIPRDEECRESLDQAEQIVRTTIPGSNASNAADSIAKSANETAAALKEAPTPPVTTANEEKKPGGEGR